ncbi:transposase [Streptomyces sp. NPDC058695]|uniref:transposase n=1 Tax=Streptomyces sp. NPDC058695 TaxID=3346604 RepID=UPI003650396D
MAKVWADGGYQSSVFQHEGRPWVSTRSRQTADSERFSAAAKGWVIERTFGWVMQHRRLARDYETLPRRSGQ